MNKKANQKTHDILIKVQMKFQNKFQNRFHMEFHKKCNFLWNIASNSQYTQLLTHWSCVFLALTHRYEVVVGKSTWHDDVIEWKHFPRYWPFVRGIHRSPVNSPHKGQWPSALMVSLICVWINGWVNNRGAGDLICYDAPYDVIVMYEPSAPLYDVDASLREVGDLVSFCPCSCAEHATRLASKSLQRTRAPFQYRDVFPGVAISIMKVRLSWDILFIIVVGIPTLVRYHLYIETPSVSSKRLYFSTRSWRR